ncbi:ROK family transcriptional regulator [Candidatus Haliotispira prima]|uniref:ROK family transcriptional regulator n=1 Tax=Candidatus Haliotispira prima TaxID=3034016 RepID=A0ABY8MFV7_9SPIO|nr:ROK family transcriptional regulator [Candidatus Haliotispira prima]
MTYNDRARISIYNAIRKSVGLSRSEVADRTGLARSTISLQVAELLRSGFLQEAGKNLSQRKLKLSIHPEKGYFIGALLGTRRFSVQIVNLHYQVVAEMQCHLQNIHDPHSCNTFLLETLQELIESNPQVQGRIFGLGLGLPFPVNFEAGKPDSPPYIPLWHDFPMVDFYSEGLEIPVLIDNDVNVMAWAEVVREPKLDNTLFIKLGTGIGCGIVLHQGIYRGAQGSAGDIGHIAVSEQNKVCHCGHSGCLEATAGREALLAEAEKAVGEGESVFLQGLLAKGRQRKLALRDLQAAIQANDSFTIRLFQKEGERIGSVLSSLVNVLNPDSIILGGSVSEAGGLYLLRAIHQHILYRSPHLATMKLNIQMTKDFLWGGSFGAAALIGEHIFEQEFHRQLGSRNG